MYSFDRTVKDFFRRFDRFINNKYVTEENKFIRNRKMPQKECTAYILTERSCNCYTEAIRFFTIMMNNDLETISSQAIGKQRIFINPQVFIDMNEEYIDKIYSKCPSFSTQKGYIISATDGSIIDLPNVTLTRKEFPLGDEYSTKPKRIRARVSCTLDVHSQYILTAKIVETTINEVDLAIEHLENLKHRFDITRIITIYDRGYGSIELMIKTMDLDSKFLIRLPKSTFKREIQKNAN